MRLVAGMNGTWEAQGSRKGVLISLIIFATLLTFTGEANPSLWASTLPTSGWPMLQHDAGHTSSSAYPGPTTNLTRWVFGVPSAYQSSPVVASSGTIYVVASDRHLYALNPDGSLKWSRKLGEVGYTPAIGLDGTIYVPTVHRILAFTAAGVPKWNLQTAQNSGAALTVGPNGQIYSVNTGTVYSITPSGNVTWAANATCQASPVAVGPAGTLYCGGAAGNDLKGLVSAINSRGIVDWTFSTGAANPVHLSPAVGSTGVVYAASANGTVYALNSDGSLRWKNINPRRMNAPVAIGADGTIYAAGAKVVAIAPDGTLKWVQNCYYSPFSTSCLPFGAVSGIAVDSNGVIYLGEGASLGSSYLLALSPDGTFLWRYRIPQVGEGIESQPALANGTIYFATACSFCPVNGTEGHLYSLGRSPSESLFRVSQTGMLPNASWSVKLDGKNFVSNSSSVSFTIANGTHNWIAPTISTSLSTVRIIPRNGSGSLAVPQSTSLVISFVKQYLVEFRVFPSGGGSTTPPTGWFFLLQKVAISAMPRPGFAFAYWSTGSNSLRLDSASTSRATLLINGSGTVTATFDPEITISSGSGGSVLFLTPPPPLTVLPSTSSTIPVAYGSDVVLYAQSNPPYVFAGWLGVTPDKTRPAVISILVTSPTSVAATFSIQTSSTSTTTAISSSFTSTSEISTSTAKSTIATTAEQPPSGARDTLFFAGTTIFLAVSAFLMILWIRKK